MQQDRGLHQILFRFSLDDYKELGQIWKGAHPEDGSPLRVVDGPPEDFTPPELPEEPQLTSPLGPEIDAGLFLDMAKRIFGTSL